MGDQGDGFLALGPGPAAEGLHRQCDERRDHRRRLRVPFSLRVGGLALFALAAVGTWALADRGHAGAPVARMGEAAPSSQVPRRRLDVLPADYCSQTPYMSFDKDTPVTYNNLANTGPDHGKGEGMVINTKCSGRGAGSQWDKPILTTINITNVNYIPFNSRVNRVKDGMGQINVIAGSHMDLRFHFFDPDTMERVTLPEMAFTVYDMDMAADNSSAKAVTMHGIKDYRTSGPNSQVHVTKLANGDHMFVATHKGGAADNPTDPVYLTQKQRKRAFTVRYEDLRQLSMTFSAGPGKGGRIFLFSFRPVMMCGEEVEEGFSPSLPNIIALPPLQEGIKVSEGEKFSSWRVLKDQKVNQGDMICVTTKADGSEHTYMAPYSGTVVAAQTMLQPNDDLDVKLGNGIIAVIEKDFFPPLKRSEDGIVAGGPGDNTQLSDQAIFYSWHKKVGDVVHRHEAIASAQDEHGFIVEILATEVGIVHERQAILRGDPVMQVQDKELITLARLPKLVQGRDSYKAGKIHADILKKKPIFEAYHVQVGEGIAMGDVIATVRDENHDIHEILAHHGGMVTELQDLIKGDPAYRIEDDNLVTVGKFAPLKLDAAKEVPVMIEGKHMEFGRWSVHVGDEVKAGDEICVLTTYDGLEAQVLAPRKGQVVRLQKGLKEGMLLHKVMDNSVLAVLGRLEPLEVARGEEGVFAPAYGHWLLADWKAWEGDEVLKGDPVATVKNSDTGVVEVIRAPMSGRLDKIHPDLKVGDIVDEVTPDNDIGTIGKFKEVKVGMHEVAIKVPSMDVVFETWLVRPGNRVEEGDFVAKVTRPAAIVAGLNSRRLREETLFIPAPASGWVQYKVGHLQAGLTVGEQMMGLAIAKIQLGWPTWYYIAGGLAALGVILAILAVVLSKSGKGNYLLLQTDPGARSYTTPRDGVKGTTPRDQRSKSYQ